MIIGNNHVTHGKITTSDTTDATNKDTGAIVTEGGIAAELQIRAGTAITAGTSLTASNGDITATTGNLVLNKASGYGIKVDTTSPVFTYHDLLGYVVVRTTGTGSPDLKVLQGNIRGYAYGAGDDGDGAYHIGHDYIPASDTYIHAHWEHTGTAISGTFVLMMYMSYAKGHNQANFPPEIAIPIKVSTPNIATIPSHRHRIDEIQCSESGGVIASAINVSITSGAAILTAASALWDAGDIGTTVRITGAGASGGNLDTTISGFTSSTQVTLAANASTTVTTQPNYKVRVLDTDNFEVDGLIKCHYDVITIPTITGADTPSSANEPFILYVDMHYLSSGVGTKNKAPNFYS
jgi:hypothetical protein